MLTFMGLSFSAKTQIVIASGDCGTGESNLVWILTDDSTLTISGSGAMANYERENDAPWYYHRYKIKTLIVENEVISVGNNAFKHCIYMTSAVIGNAVTTIGEYAFFHCRKLESVSFPDALITIGRVAFSGCINLTESIVSESVTVEEAAFGGCKKLQK